MTAPVASILFWDIPRVCEGITVSRFTPGHIRSPWLSDTGVVELGSISYWRLGAVPD